MYVNSELCLSFKMNFTVFCQIYIIFRKIGPAECKSVYRI